jgi:hypothetical protein
MEFPPDTLELLPAHEFETAGTRQPGKAAMELQVQARPNGRCVDHFKIALGGSGLLQASVPMNRIFSASVLGDYKMQFQFWGRDIKIRRNMCTSTWADAYAKLAAREVTVVKDEAEVEIADVLQLLDGLDDPAGRAGAYRFGVVAGHDKKMHLEMVALPASAATISSKPTLVG